MHKHTHHSKGMRAVTAALLWSLAWRGRECGAAKDDLPAAGTSKGNSSALIFRQVYPWLHWALFLSCKANGKNWSARTTDETKRSSCRYWSKESCLKRQRVGRRSQGWLAGAVCTFSISRQVALGYIGLSSSHVRLYLALRGLAKMAPVIIKRYMHTATAA